MRALIGLLAFGCVSLAVAQQAPAGPKRYALVIGNGTYQHLPKAPTALKNAEAVASTLAGLGFELERPHYDLTPQQMAATVSAFGQRIEKGSVALVFYSGFGLRTQGENFLLPVDFNPAEGEARMDWRAYDLSRIPDILRERAGAVILILDASRECPPLEQRFSTVGMQPMDPPSNTLILFSTGFQRATKDPSDGSIGLFASALVEALRTPGFKPVDVVTRVQAEVGKKSGGAQFPSFVSALVTEFYFSPPKPVPAPKPVVVAETLKAGALRENPKDRLNYVWIPEGQFEMGCVPADQRCLDDERPRHDVKITRGFWITRTEVTVGAYDRFIKDTGHKPPARTKTNPNRILTDHPVTKVSWQDARDYCAWASAGGRLPTEAEWEYAARGGHQDQIYPWGNEFDPKRARSFKSRDDDKRFDETVPVGLFDPNGFNLFDMVGNAREWTEDVYDPRAYSSPGPHADPVVESGSKLRVIRGGSWYGAPEHLRTSIRDHREPDREVTNQTGFRCVAPKRP